MRRVHTHIKRPSKTFDNLAWYFRIIHFIFGELFVGMFRYATVLTLYLLPCVYSIHEFQHSHIYTMGARIKWMNWIYRPKETGSTVMSKSKSNRVSEKEAKKKWQPMSSIFCFCLDRIYITLTWARHKLDHTIQLTRWLTIGVVVVVATAFFPLTFSLSSYVVLTAFNSHWIPVTWSKFLIWLLQ